MGYLTHLKYTKHLAATKTSIHKYYICKFVYLLFFNTLKIFVNFCDCEFKLIFIMSFSKNLFAIKIMHSKVPPIFEYLKL
jgi:hypothetical protein